MGLFGKWSRRDLLKSSGAMAGAITPVVATAASANALPVHNPDHKDNLFTRIGVRPIINGRGTYTIISGSRSLPQVKQAMFEASHYYVHLDEMMDGIGPRLGQLTGAQWGIATNGCEAATRFFMKTNYHKPSDDLSQPIRYDVGAKFARLNYPITRELADGARPSWNKGDFFAAKFAGK